MSSYDMTPYDMTPYNKSEDMFHNPARSIWQFLMTDSARGLLDYTAVQHAW
jgi:hypothetical protein